MIKWERGERVIVRSPKSRLLGIDLREELDGKYSAYQELNDDRIEQRRTKSLYYIDHLDEHTALFIDSRSESVSVFETWGVTRMEDLEDRVGLVEVTIPLETYSNYSLFFKERPEFKEYEDDFIYGYRPMKGDVLEFLGKTKHPCDFYSIIYVLRDGFRGNIVLMSSAAVEEIEEE